MKKYLLIVIMLLTYNAASSQNELSLDVGVAGSYSLDNEYYSIYVNDTYKGYYRYDPFMTRVQLRLNRNNLSLISDTYCYMEATSSMKFKPSLMVYNIELRYTHNKIKVGVEHSCVHSVINTDMFSRPMLRGGFNAKLTFKYNIE